MLPRPVSSPSREEREDRDADNCAHGEPRQNIRVEARDPYWARMRGRPYGLRARDGVPARVRDPQGDRVVYEPRVRVRRIGVGARAAVAEIPRKSERRGTAGNLTLEVHGHGDGVTSPTEGIAVVHANTERRVPASRRSWVTQGEGLPRTGDDGKREYDGGQPESPNGARSSKSRSPAGSTWRRGSLPRAAEGPLPP